MNKTSAVTRLSNYAQQTKKYVFAHKIRSVLAIFLVLIAGYWMYQKVFASDTQTRYVLSTASKGTIIVSVSGSGQVSPSNQVEIHPKASGEVTAVRVKNGQTVSAGDVIAYIDSTDAQASLRDAQNNLKSAQLSLQKLEEPTDELTLTQAEHAVEKAREAKVSAENDLKKAYEDAHSDIIKTYLDMPEIMTNYKDMVIGTNSNSNSQWNIDYYRNAVQNYDNNTLTYRDTAYDGYKASKSAYDASLAAYQLAPSTPSNTEIETSLNDTYKMVKTVSTGLKSTNSFIRFYSDEITARDGHPVSAATNALTDLTTYINQTNTTLSTLLADINAIESAKRAIASAERSIIESEQSLAKTKAGTDTLDLQSSELSVETRRNAVITAQNNLANYVIRAPFDGTITGLDLNVGDSVSSGTTVATEITSQDLAVLSLNEVDAAKVKEGQKTTLTFDAIEDLTLTGVVTTVDALGTVSQGVVSYEVQIAFDAQDSRVKPGMTVNASIITDLKQNVVIVPSSAVKTRGNSSYVLVFDTPPTSDDSSTSSSQGIISDVTPREQVVEVGLTNDTEAEIISGLDEGVTIVTRTITASATTASTASTPGLFGGGSGARQTTGAVRATTGTGR